MHSITPFVVLLAMAGCAASRDGASNPRSRRDLIEVGQPLAEAVSVAKRANYAVREDDPIEVEWMPQPSGFVLEIHQDFDLYVIQDKSSNIVRDLCLVSHPSKPKNARAYLYLKSFALPIAAGKKGA